MATKSKRITAQSIREHAKKDHSPKWDGCENWTDDEFATRFREAMKYYNLEFSAKDLRPKVIDWMGHNGYDKVTIASFKKTKEWRCNVTTGAIAACLLKGMPAERSGFNNGQSTAEWLRDQITTIIEDGKADIEVLEESKAAKAAAPVVSIQDRIRDQAAAMCEEIDAAIDSFILDPESFDPKAFKMVNALRGKGAKAAQTRYIKSFYAGNHAELLELASGDADEQLREAYSHLSRKNVKKLIDFYDSIVTACDQIAAEAKVLKKPRAKKAVSAEKIVAKMKFKISDDKLGLTSVPATQIIGAQTAIVYNGKTRKLGVYTAKTSEGLGVKGTSITNFTDKSVQKTLRKPDQQIKEFKEQNTGNRVKTWFDKIKATEVKLNGRVNAEIMILKVFK